MTRSLSVIVPALNEEMNIAATLGYVREALATAAIDDAEIIVVTCMDRNGKRDRTVEIVQELAVADPRIRLLYSETFRPLGANYRDAVLAATKEYVIMIPGDNENHEDSFPHLFRAAGTADIVLAYTANGDVRPLYRRVLSWLYIRLLNFFFNERIRYYNGTNVYRTAQLREALPETDSFMYAAEILLTLLKRGATYVEVPVHIRPRPGASKALRWENVIGVARSFFILKKKLASMKTRTESAS